ncbi:d-tyrosyl-tRNA(Tyr) deacylase [Clostridium sp. CAG:710]|jgi:D-tyrosyl-tRNA(Tyr) deacylase|nr:d-tyrosyl-tRNA(Tyr) deacylase [Clostridium sp. CAG:710]
MRVLVQRALSSSVTVDNEVIGRIDKGAVLLVGFTEGDNSDTIDYMVNKVLNLRIYDDSNGVMNKSILDVGGSILSISQFTLYANSKKGNRPSYINALNGEKAISLYEEFNNKLSRYICVETGKFGADMLVDIKNDGPVTIMLERE